MNHDQNNDNLRDAINRIEISVKNSQNDIKKLFLHSARQEITSERLDKNLTELQVVVAGIASATAAGFAENRERLDQQGADIRGIKEEIKGLNTRFDQLELLIRQALPNH